MYLDGRHFGAAMWETRFPTILAACRSHGIDPVTEPIPVAPAAHYASGGVRTDLRGRTTVPGLYACGEVACTGVHGANRLASNSLLEGLVFAERIARTSRPSPTESRPPRPPAAPDPPLPSLRPDRITAAAPPGRRAAQRRGPAPPPNWTASTAGGRTTPGTREHWPLSGAAGRTRTRRSADAAPADRKAPEPGVEAWEATNLLCVARVLVGGGTAVRRPAAAIGARTTRTVTMPPRRHFRITLMMRTAR